MNINILGIDIAKNVFQLHGIDEAGKAVLKKRLHRRELLPFMAIIKSGTVVMEACGGANYWHRQFNQLGHACATHLINSGITLKEISDLGHQDIDSTCIYAKVDLVNLRKVADLQLGDLL